MAWVADCAASQVLPRQPDHPRGLWIWGTGLYGGPGTGSKVLLQVPGSWYIDETSLPVPGFCQAAGHLGIWVLSPQS